MSTSIESVRPNSQVPTVSALSPPTMGCDGTVFAVLKKTDVILAGCFAAEQTLSSLTETLELLQVATDGTTSLTQLRQDTSAQTPTGSFGGQVSIPLVPNQNFNSNSLLLDYYQPIPQAQAFHVIPDGQGGTLAPYTFANVQDFVALPPYHQRIAHFSAGALQADFPLPFQATSDPQDFPMGTRGNSGTGTCEEIAERW